MDRHAALIAMLRPTVEALGYHLWGIEFLPQGKHSLLRIYIDHEDGIKVEDCEKVSHQLSAVLSVEDPIAGHYTLEVSSPGLDRPLFTPDQYRHFCGDLIKLRLLAAIENRRKFVGRLQEVTETGIVVEVDNKTVAIDFGNIDKANIEPEF